MKSPACDRCGGALEPETTTVALSVDSREVVVAVAVVHFACVAAIQADGLQVRTFGWGRALTAREVAHLRALARVPSASMTRATPIRRSPCATTCTRNGGRSHPS
ncbi:MAG TPA: hypothetical protein VMT03_02085 [Polyangia bacterium]|nr:hypothetical protein [Polyangia bacterium]